MRKHPKSIPSYMNVCHLCAAPSVDVECTSLLHFDLVLICAGTFLYVAFMEVIPRELAVPNHRSAKLAMLLLGFAAMSLLAIWA
jgi:hypothetical protein